MPRIAHVMGFVLLGFALGGGCVIDRQITNIVPVVCGNGLCEEGEGPGRCPVDCPIGICGNQACELGEDYETCLADCAEDLSQTACEPWESSPENQYCGAPRCGDTRCDGEETTETCPDDCFPGHCGDGRCDANERARDCPEDCTPTSQLDLLFVVDDSETMAEAQERLAEAMSTLIAELRSAEHEVPDLHVGVISADLGNGMFTLPDCLKDGWPGGDGGRLLAPANPAYAGITYLSDAAPTGCTITRALDGTCTSYECRETSCDAAGGVLAVDAVTGCPRCRNFAGDLAVVMGDFVRLGTAGCRFAQPLEATEKALGSPYGGPTPANAGFLRTDSILGIYFLTNQDDCSASNPQLFDDTLTTIDSPLGALTTFRCFEFGVTCRPTDSRTAQGPRTECQPREDPGALLYPTSRYLEILDYLRDPGRRLVMVNAGPAWNHDVSVGLDASNFPAIMPTCGGNFEPGAQPAIRLRSFEYQATGGNAEPLPWIDQNWGGFSICQESYAPHLETFGQALQRRLAP